MRNFTVRGWTLTLALVLATGPLAAAVQDAPPDPATLPTVLSGDLTEVPASELEILLAPLTFDELQALSDETLAALRALGGELATALVEQQRARDAGAGAGDEPSPEDVRVEALLARKKLLVSRTETVLSALKTKGGDVEAARMYVSVVQGLEPDDPAPAISDAPTDEEEPLATGEGQVDGEELEAAAQEAQAEAALQEAVNAAVAAIRDQPPAHEREEPWAVPRRELELELQPLRVAEVEERAAKWLEILQREVRRRIRIDIVLTTVEDSAQQAELARRSAAQQEVVQAVVDRIKVALEVLQRRGGDTGVYEKYIATATGQKLNLTDIDVLYAQAMAWLRSREGGISLGLDLLLFIGIVLSFWILSRLLARAVGSAVGRMSKATSLMRDFLVNGTRRLVMLIGLVIAVGALGVNITPLVAAIGAIGLVVGLALQGTLSNFASGILILFYRPFDVGDVINGGGVTGKVESMSLMSTSILTLDNQVMIVPNNQIWDGVITNVTGRDTRRVDLVFGIGYGDDIQLAEKVLLEAMTSHELVLDDPAPMVRVHELGDNSVNLIARPWTRTQDYWDVYWDLTRDVKQRFDAAGLNIPFPQRDLHVPGTIEVRLADGTPPPPPAPDRAPADKARSEPGPAEPAPVGGPTD